LGKHEQIPELLAYFDVEGQPYLVQQFIDRRIHSLKSTPVAKTIGSDIQDSHDVRSIAPIETFMPNI
jgi:hypothetical protein